MLLWLLKINYYYKFIYFFTFIKKVVKIFPKSILKFHFWTF